MLPNANSRLRTAFDPALFSQQLTDATNQCVVYFVYVPQVQECQAVAQEVGAVFNGDFEQVFGGGFQGVTPRLGLAWDAMGDGRVVVRAGWGMYKSAFPSAVIDETRSALDEFLPVNATLSGANITFYHLPNPAVPCSIAAGYGRFCPNGLQLQQGTLNLLVPGSNPIAVLAFSNYLPLEPVLIRRLRQPYSMQFNSTVEVGFGASVLNIAYVGSLGRRLIVASTPGGGLGYTYSGLSPLGADYFGFPVISNGIVSHSFSKSQKSNSRAVPLLPMTRFS